MEVRDHESSEQLESLAALFAEGPVAILTGAGVSTDSGIPDYRGAGTPPRTPMSIDQFMHNEAYRRRFWAGARAGALRTRGIEPNPGHLAIAELEFAGLLTGVITQNVDGLHARAATQTALRGRKGLETGKSAHRGRTTREATTSSGAPFELAELHGNGGVIRCVPEGHRFTRTEVLAWFDAANPGFTERNADADIAPDGDADVAESEYADVRVPICPACGGLLRPDVVYFGEHVPQQVFAHAERIVAHASALVIAGSSLAVNTGVRLVHRAERRGVPLAVINRGPTAADRRASLRVRIESGTTETLTALVEMLGAGPAN